MKPSELGLVTSRIPGLLGFLGFGPVFLHRFQHPGRWSWKVQRYLRELEIGWRFPRSVTVEDALRKRFCISASSRRPMALTQESKFLRNVVERCKSHHRGVMAACSAFGANVGVMLGSTTGAILAWILPRPELIAWGWRVPFLLGIAIGIAGARRPDFVTRPTR